MLVAAAAFLGGANTILKAKIERVIRKRREEAADLTPSCCTKAEAGKSGSIMRLKVLAVLAREPLMRSQIKEQAAEREGRTPLTENASLTPHSGDHDGRVPLQWTKEQPHKNSTLEASSASVAIRIQYRGIERTIEFPLMPHTIGQLALEAAIRHVTIGELITELITAVLSKDLFPLVLDNIDPES